MARDHLLAAAHSVALLRVSLACGPSSGEAADSEATTSSTETLTSGDVTDATSVEPTTASSSSSSTATSASSDTGADDSTDTSSSTTGSGTGESTTGEPSVCGDGFITGIEGCDDSNSDDFDGCSAACRIESPATSVWLGGSVACATFGDGSLRCWGGGVSGSNGSGTMDAIGDEAGEMGGALDAVDLGFAFVAEEVGYLPCARSGSAVKCWGFGPLTGLGDSENRGDEPGEMGDALPTVDLGGEALWLGDHCAHLGSGLKCWGWNAWGELGLGDTAARGDEPGEMGDNLPFTDLGDVGTLVDQCAGGSGYRCAIDDLGALKCWGLNDRGMLGTEDFENRGDEPGEMGDNLLPVDLGTDASVVQIACGRATVCAVLDGGALKCWGESTHGELVDLLGDVTYGTWGGFEGQMGDGLPEIVPDPERTVAEVRVGYDVVCVRFEDGAVKCWGDDGAGALGQGEWSGVFSSSAEIPMIDLGTDEHAAQISVGTGFACALLEGGHIKCWGENHLGQLGYEDTEDRGDDPYEMGDNLPYIRFF